MILVNILFGTIYISFIIKKNNQKYIFYIFNFYKKNK